MLLLFIAANAFASPAGTALPSPAVPALASQEDLADWPIAWHGTTTWFEGWADPRTETPHRMFGGLELEDEVTSDDQAIDVAWELLEENEWLLQIPLYELRLERVEELHGQWVVLFERWHSGYRVEGARVDIRIRQKRVLMMGVDTFPFLSEDSTPPREGPRSDDIVWLPLDQDGAITGVLTERIEVQEPGVWETWYMSGDEPVAYVELLRHFRGTLSAQVDDRTPASGATLIRPLPLLEIGGRITATDGSLELDESFTANSSLSGRYIELHGAQGSSYTATLRVDAATPNAMLNSSGDDTSYLDVYVYGNAVSQRIRELDWQNEWARAKVPAYVNIYSTCNAYYDGWSINFYREGGGCNNTGRISDIVYHEFGHGTHYAALVSGGFDGSVSEGAGDYLSATMTDDPLLAPGFYTSGSALRTADNDKVYPNDWVGEVHADGEIYLAALWDLREMLIAKHGYHVGVERADAYWYATIQGSNNMTDSYGEAVLRADDDGDLSNGVLDGCAIAEAFRAHGLLWGPEVRSSLELRHVPATKELKAEVLSCGSTVQRVWADFEDGSTVELSQEGKFWVASMPQKQGVRSYTLTADDGQDSVQGSWSLPVGPVATQMCESFEEGWGEFTHGALSRETGMRALDEWQLGKPRGQAGDPTRARDGEKVAGMDLTTIIGDIDGRYEPNAEFWLKSPQWTVTGKNPRLRFWTKLSLEDDYDEAWMVVNGETIPSTSSDDWVFWEFPVTGETASLELWLRSDAGVERGGWNLDAVCLVADPAEPDNSVEDEQGWKPGGNGELISNCGCNGAPLGMGWAALLLALAGVRRRR